MRKKLDAVIFDVDGLILDSELFYAQAWADSFNNFSPEKYRVDKEFMVDWYFENLAGKRIFDQLNMIQEKFKNNDIPKIYAEYCKLFRARLITDSIPVREGFFELLNYLKSHNVRLAIVSSSELDVIKNSFNNTNVDISDFEIIVSGDIVSKRKPNPEPYLKGCELLNVDKTNIIVLEDSESGVLSATNANLDCYLIRGRVPVSDVVKAKTCRVCNNLSEMIPSLEREYLI